MLTLETFNETVMKPMIVDGIKNGRFDTILLEPDIIDIIAKDDDLFAAFMLRMPELRKLYGYV